MGFLEGGKPELSGRVNTKAADYETQLNDLLQQVPSRKWSGLQHISGEDWGDRKETEKRERERVCVCLCGWGGAKLDPDRIEGLDKQQYRRKGGRAPFFGKDDNDNDGLTDPSFSSLSIYIPYGSDMKQQT